MKFIPAILLLLVLCANGGTKPVPKQPNIPNSRPFVNQVENIRILQEMELVIFVETIYYEPYWDIDFDCLDTSDLSDDKNGDMTVRPCLIRSTGVS